MMLNIHVWRSKIQVEENYFPADFFVMNIHAAYWYKNVYFSAIVNMYESQSLAYMYYC